MHSWWCEFWSSRHLPHLFSLPGEKRAFTSGRGMANEKGTHLPVAAQGAQSPADVCCPLPPTSLSALLFVSSPQGPRSRQPRRPSGMLLQSSGTWGCPFLPPLQHAAQAPKWGLRGNPQGKHPHLPPPPSSHMTTLTRAHGPVLQQDMNRFLERVLILSPPSLRLYFSLCSHSCRLLWSILSLNYGFRDASWRPGHLSHLPSVSHNMKRMFPTFHWSFSTTVHLQ